MSQLTSPAPDSPDRPGRRRIRDRLRRAVRGPEQEITTWPYQLAGPHPGPM